MTAKPTKNSDVRQSDNDTERQAKGSVQEAIGKLIGDDAVRDRGTAQKDAGADHAVQQKSSRP